MLMALASEQGLSVSPEVEPSRKTFPLIVEIPVFSHKMSLNLLKHLVLIHDGNTFSLSLTKCKVKVRPHILGNIFL